MATKATLDTPISKNYVDFEGDIAQQSHPYFSTHILHHNNFSVALAMFNPFICSIPLRLSSLIASPRPSYYFKLTCKRCRFTFTASVSPPYTSTYSVPTARAPQRRLRRGPWRPDVTVSSPYLLSRCTIHSQLMIHRNFRRTYYTLSGSCC